MELKPVRWVGRSREDVRTFPQDARRIIGKEILRVQLGFDPTDWRPMPAVGIGAREIRVHAGNEYRVLYIASFTEAIYVLHAFVKKTQAAPKHHIDLARQRLRLLKEARGLR
ncbi:MAG: hypothetical protein A2V83_05770 [Nitrospirae bacterium RBG_16_64_22]|nr:MAG: hypothetical protein A2V83_05770 [Nitrospirae bacterium RBG_16_64_22]